MSDAPAAASFSALGTTATIALLDPTALPAAQEQLARQLDAVDRACSRFRAGLRARPRERLRRDPRCRSVPCSRGSCGSRSTAARASDGLVDPTLGAQLRRSGTTARSRSSANATSWRVAPRRDRGPTWKDVELDEITTRSAFPSASSSISARPRRRWRRTRPRTRSRRRATPECSSRSAATSPSPGRRRPTAGPCGSRTTTRHRRAPADRPSRSRRAAWRRRAPRFAAGDRLG